MCSVPDHTMDIPQQSDVSHMDIGGGISLTNADPKVILPALSLFTRGLGRVKSKICYQVTFLLWNQISLT